MPKIRTRRLQRRNSRKSRKIHRGGTRSQADELRDIISALTAYRNAPEDTKKEKAVELLNEFKNAYWTILLNPALWGGYLRIINIIVTKYPELRDERDQIQDHYVEVIERSAGTVDAGARAGVRRPRRPTYDSDSKEEPTVYESKEDMP
jgi:hypothetical protein